MCVEYYDLMGMIEEYKYRILTLLKIRVAVAMVNVMTFFFFMFIAYNVIRTDRELANIDIMFFVLICICCVTLMAVEHIIRTYCFKLHRLIMVNAIEGDKYPVNEIMNQSLSFNLTVMCMYLFKYSYIILILSFITLLELLGFK